MLTANIRNIAIAAFFAALTVAVIFGIHNGRIVAHNINDATGAAKDYVIEQKAQLEDPKNKKALDAAIELGAVYNGMGRSVNTLIIPRGMRTLDSLTASENALTALIQHQDANATSILAYARSDVLPQLVASARALTGLEQRLGVTADDAATIIKQSGTSIDQVNAILASSAPQIHAALDLVARVASGVDATVEDFHRDLHATMANWPTIAAEIEKTTKNIAKFSKISIISAIFTNIANGIIPGLLH
jgi:hypothetical protein